MDMLRRLISCRIIIIIIITTLSIHNSFTFPLQAKNLLFQEILHTLIDFWYPLHCLHGSIDCTRLTMFINRLHTTYHVHQ